MYRALVRFVFLMAFIFIAFGRISAQIASDVMGNVYQIKGTELVKTDIAFDTNYTYSRLNNGPILSVDPTNPMKILVYYLEQQKILFLDNTLSPVGNAIALTEYGLEQSSLACSSINNGLWLFDQSAQQLVRLDRNLKEIARSLYINQIIGKAFSPTNMREFEEVLYVLSPGVGILQFDIFGSYMGKISENNAKAFSIWDNQLYLLQSDGIYRYNKKTLELNPVYEVQDIQYFSALNSSNILIIKDNKMQTINLKK